MNLKIHHRHVVMKLNMLDNLVGAFYERGESVLSTNSH
jgi:hypothetical protein